MKKSHFYSVLVALTVLGGAVPALADSWTRVESCGDELVVDSDGNFNYQIVLKGALADEFAKQGFPKNEKGEVIASRGTRRGGPGSMYPQFEDYSVVSYQADERAVFARATSASTIEVGIRKSYRQEPTSLSKSLEGCSLSDSMKPAN